MSGNTSFIHYFEIAPRIENMFRVLNSLSLLWAADHEVDYSVTQNGSGDGVVKAEEWYGVVPFRYVRSVHHSERSI